MNTPLFKTHDGIDVFDCHRIWVLRNLNREPEELKILDNVYGLYSNKGYLFFASKENAFNYWEENRPIYSKKQVGMFLEFTNPIPVIVEGDKDGYAIYVRDGATWENDIWCVVHCDGGFIRHYRSDQIIVHKNGTFDISQKHK